MHFISNSSKETCLSAVYTSLNTLVIMSSPVLFCVIDHPVTRFHYMQSINFVEIDINLFQDTTVLMYGQLPNQLVSITICSS